MNLYSNDKQLKKMTLEEQRKNHINNILEDFETNDELDYDIDKECDEDQKAYLIEQIDALRESLIDDNIDISRIPLADPSGSLNEIKLIYKTLVRKNDRNRFSSLAEELILVGAGGIELWLNGDREILGSKPDARGWSSQVKIKLRRMKYETSTLVQNIMQDYYTSPIWRILFELVPNLFLYTRNKARRNAENSLNEMDNQYNDAISNINNMM